MLDEYCHMECDGCGQSVGETYATLESGQRLCSTCASELDVPVITIGTPKQRQARILAVPALVIFFLLGAVSLYYYYSSNHAHKITNLKDPAIADAIGLVVCGFDVNGHQIGICQGSCFVIDSNGLAVTNKHVVALLNEIIGEIKRDPDQFSIEQDINVSPRIWVYLNGAERVADVEYVSTDSDIALLRIPSPKAYFAIERTAPARTDDIWAGGFPAAASFGFSSYDDIVRSANSSKPRIKDQLPKREFSYTMTEGSISRIVEDESGETWLQHSAIISGGNSGGPLLNSEGRVIGVNTITIEDTYYFAISINQIIEEIESRTHNDRPIVASFEKSYRLLAPRIEETYFADSKPPAYQPPARRTPPPPKDTIVRVPPGQYKPKPPTSSSNRRPKEEQADSSTNRTSRTRPKRNQQKPNQKSVTTMRAEDFLTPDEKENLNTLRLESQKYADEIRTAKKVGMRGTVERRTKLKEKTDEQIAKLLTLAQERKDAADKQ